MRALPAVPERTSRSDVSGWLLRFGDDAGRRYVGSTSDSGPGTSTIAEMGLELGSGHPAVLKPSYSTLGTLGLVG